MEPFAALILPSLALVSPEQEKFIYAALASLFTAILASIGYFIKRAGGAKSEA